MKMIRFFILTVSILLLNSISFAKSVGIVGGVGPEAGLVLHKYVIDFTKLKYKPKKDQNHGRIIHLSMPDQICDRTSFLLNKEKKNPALGAFEVVKLINDIGKKTNEVVNVGVPCNTFHAPPIFMELKRLIKVNKLKNIKLFNMIEETVKSIKKAYPKVKKIGILSTIGTRDTKIYQTPFEKSGIEVILVPKKMQEKVHDSIYNPKWGIKSSNHKPKKTRKKFEKFAGNLKKQGAEIILLGCTEIPLILTEEKFKEIPLINPIKMLAESLVEN